MELPHLQTQEDVKAEAKSQEKEDKHDRRPQQSFHNYLQHNDENSTIFKSRKIKLKYVFTFLVKLYFIQC